MSIFVNNIESVSPMVIATIPISATTQKSFVVIIYFLRMLSVLFDALGLDQCGLPILEQ